MTLADLAALAAKVEGFVRPESGMCSGCGYEMGYCACSDKGPEWDNSPAALAMAVWALPGRRVEKYANGVYVFGPHDTAWCRHDGTPEEIARALLVALLRANGVEVPDA